MAWQTPKTNWTSADVPAPSDFNRIEGNTAQLKTDLDTHTSATTGVHGATSAATPNRIVQRDSAGRFKAAAPSASDDVARKAETDAAMAAASNAQATANAALPKAGGTMTGSLKVDGNGGIGAYTWLTISSANNGRAVLSDNSYIDVSTGQLKYKNNHESLGARGIMFDWGAVKYFDTGSVAATANQVFTPTMYKMWHEGNDGAGSGLDADLLDGMQPSTSASADTIVQRDSNGRIKAAAPSASDDVARKAETDAAMAAAQAAQNTANAALPASQYTASDILTKLKTVDGADSGLDADLLRGKPGNQFMATYGDAVDNANTATAPGTYRFGPSVIGGFPSAGFGNMVVLKSPTADTLAQIGIPYNQTEMYFRTGTTSDFYNKTWTRVWHDGNQPQLRINNGVLEYNDEGTWKPVGFDPTSMTVNTINGYVGSISLSGSQSVDILSLSGAGVLGQLEIAVLGNDSDRIGISLIVDGVEKPLYSADGTTARTITKTAHTNPTNSTTAATPCAIELFTPIKYSSSLVVRAKNLSTASSSTGWGFKGVYYT